MLKNGTAVAYGERGAGPPRAPPVRSRTRRSGERAPFHATEPKATGGAPRPAPRPRTLRIPFFRALRVDEPAPAVGPRARSPRSFRPPQDHAPPFRRRGTAWRPTWRNGNGSYEGAIATIAPGFRRMRRPADRAFSGAFRMNGRSPRRRGGHGRSRVTPLRRYAGALRGHSGRQLTRLARLDERGAEADEDGGQQEERARRRHDHGERDERA